MNNFLKYISLMFIGFSISGCAPYELAQLHPIGKFEKDMPKNERSVHLIGLQKDIYGNKLSAYLNTNNSYYRELYLYPVPDELYVTCNELIGNGSRLEGSRYIKNTKFKPGNTYYIYCEKGPNRSFRVVSIEKNIADNLKEKEPDNSNKVIFITNGRNPKTMLIWQGTQITGLVDWDGKLKTKAELVGPRDSITVFCRAQDLFFSLKGNFKAGKTYKVECSNKTDANGYPIVDITSIN